MPLARLAGLGLAFVLLAALVSAVVPAGRLQHEARRGDIPPDATVVASPIALPVPFRVNVNHVVAADSSSLAPHPIHARRFLALVAGLAMWLGLVLGARVVFGRDPLAIVAVAGWGLWPTLVFASAHAAHGAPLGALAAAGFVLAFAVASRRLTKGVAIACVALAATAFVGDLAVTAFVPSAFPGSVPTGLHGLGAVAYDTWHGVFAPTGDAFGGFPRLVKLACLALSGAIVGGVLLVVRDRRRPTTDDPVASIDVRDDPLGLRAEAPADEPTETTEPPPPVPSAVLVIAGCGALAAALWAAFADRTHALGWSIGALPLGILATVGLARLVGARATAVVLGAGPLVATVLTIAFDTLPHYHVPSAKWARGDVLFYDDAGNPRLSPHRVADPSTVDLEMWGSYAPGRQPAMSAACGIPGVRFRYTGLDPRVPLQLRVTYFGGQEAGKFGIVPVQELWAGAVRVHGPIAVTFEPRELAWAVPQGAVTADGTLELRFRGVDGSPAAVAEIWIERPWISAKRITPKRTQGDQVVATVELANRDPDAGHPVEIALARRVDDRLETLVAQATSNPIPARSPYGVGIAAPPGAAKTDDALVLGVRRRDRSPWALWKGAMRLGPAGEKKGDLAARDLHVAARRPDSTAPVFRTDVDAPAGPWVVDVRYRSATTGSLRLLDGDGRPFATRPLDATDGYRSVRVGIRDPGHLARIEVAFAGDGGAAVDEVALWADGDETGVHRYPAGRVPARP